MPHTAKFDVRIIIILSPNFVSEYFVMENYGLKLCVRLYWVKKKNFGKIWGVAIYRVNTVYLFIQMKLSRDIPIGKRHFVRKFDLK